MRDDILVQQMYYTVQQVFFYRIAAIFCGVKFSWMAIQLYHRNYSRIEFCGTQSFPIGNVHVCGLALLHSFAVYFWRKEVNRII